MLIKHVRSVAPESELLVVEERAECPNTFTVRIDHDQLPYNIELRHIEQAQILTPLLYHQLTSLFHGHKTLENDLNRVVY